MVNKAKIQMLQGGVRMVDRIPTIFALCLSQLKL